MMKFNKNRIEKTMKNLERLRYNGMKIPQIINAIRIFILRRLNILRMSSIIGGRCRSLQNLMYGIARVQWARLPEGSLVLRSTEIHAK
jgi:hypothetical protein